ncbi:GMC family oxidoreductase [Ketobacter sp.]|uniref:GMC family oxidoreductase n=1 Tax=Ketobacter sp. TaxID=2083498 RepID=UPI000F113E02|nr:GMC family oxidoreductase [Ketobacter sp.]RLT97992.1 MAG: GMC family oxidoreductase [Ketobacter sp.]
MMLNVTTAAQVKSTSLNLEADAVVIGSGAGGAVMAYELAAAGKSVIVLEAGSHVPSSRFNEKFPDMLELLYQDGGNQATSQGDLLVLQGRCLGGSTVVNGCVTFRVPDFILKKWADEYGLTNLTPEVLAPYFDKIESNLGIHTNQPHEINENSRKLQQGAEALGWSVKPLQRNIRECALTGHCLSGCKTDRKQSMLVTYLPWASHHGARIFTDTAVTRIVAEGGRAKGVEAEVRDPETGRTVAKMSVQAKVVVTAAGAIQSPLLFQRSELGNSSGQVGKNFACHPSTMVVAEFGSDVFTWRGAMLGVYVDEFEHPDKGGFVLEGGGAGPVELGMSTEPGTGKAYLDFMSRAKNYASCVTLIHDHNVGQVSLVDGKKQIDYQIADSDFPAMKAAFKAAARIYFAAGAERVFLPTGDKRIIESVDDIDAVVDGIENNPFAIRMVSYHPQGTMRMGADPTNSVVNPYGETHDVKGLFVCDASLFPTSIIVNPQESVYALSNYIADHILQDQAGYFA